MNDMKNLPQYVEKQIKRFSSFGYAFKAYDGMTLTLIKGHEGEGKRRFAGGNFEEENEIAISDYDLFDQNGNECGFLMEITF